jgi:hypothetical protein
MDFVFVPAVRVVFCSHLHLRVVAAGQRLRLRPSTACPDDVSGQDSSRDALILAAPR